MLSITELQRYHCQILLPEIQQAGQEKLKSAKVLIVGMGGLGCPVSMQLVAAGIGLVGLVDQDKVELTNLPRQILYHHTDIGKNKLEVACTALSSLNPYTVVKLHHQWANQDNILDLIKDYDVILDCTDNFTTRYILNDACYLSAKPLIAASVNQFTGRLMMTNGNKGACLRCLYPAIPPPGAIDTCAEAGIICMVTGVLAGMQAAETIKYLLGIGHTITGNMLLYNALTQQVQNICLHKDETCALCGSNPSITMPKSEEIICMTQITCTALELKEKLASQAQFLLIDVREPSEYQVSKIDGATLIPLAQLVAEVDNLLPYQNQEIIIHCKSGIRSMSAVQFLRGKGFTHARSLSGGIEAYNQL